MDVMLTGATGFIGGHLMRALVDAGHRPRVLVRSRTKLGQMCAAHGIDPSAVDAVEGDMLDEVSVAEALDGCTSCIHAAAVTTLDPDAAADLSLVNVGGTRIVLDAAVGAGCDPIVHVSSVTAIFPPAGPVFSADDPVSTSAMPYTRSKAESERHARALQADGRPVVTVYPAAVNGPTDVGVNVGAAGFGMLLAMPLVLVPETGGMLIVDVRDLAAGTVALLTPGRGPRRYVAGGHFVLWPLVAELIDRVTGLPREHPVMGADQLREFLDEESVGLMLGTVPADDGPFLRDSGITWRPVEETLTDTLRWTVERGILGAEWAPALTA